MRKNARCGSACRCADMAITPPPGAIRMCRPTARCTSSITLAAPRSPSAGKFDMIFFADGVGIRATTIRRDRSPAPTEWSSWSR